MTPNARSSEQNATSRDALVAAVRTTFDRFLIINLALVDDEVPAGAAVDAVLSVLRHQVEALRQTASWSGSPWHLGSENAYSAVLALLAAPTDGAT